MPNIKRGPKFKRIVNTNWSENFAYAVGLLATDGYLGRDGLLIDLTSKDREQLLNFNKCLDLNLNIGIKYSGSGRRAWRIQIKNKIFSRFLRSIGFISAKSKTLEEISVPNKYYFDFLRGCFDGDGSFYSYWDKRWKSSFMFYTEFCSASPKFIKWIQEKNKNLISIEGHITKDRERITYQLKYAKRESLILLRSMYNQSNSICLSRKKLKISKVLDSIGVSVKHLSSST